MQEYAGVRRLVRLGYLYAWWSLFIAIPAHAQTGPVGWWKLDEGAGTTTADASGNNNTGTLTNSPTWVTGRVGPYAISFAGNTSEIKASAIAAVNNLHSTGLTVSAWIKPAGAGGSNAGRIVDKDNNSVGWFFAMSSANTVRLTSDSDTTGVTSLTSATTITLNTWQHVLATWDGQAGSSHMAIYINGALSTPSASTSGVGPEQDDSTSPLTIGNRPIDAARGFNGSIDDVRVYNRVLSASEITALADSTPPTAPAGLTATAASSSQINLAWTASTDNVGVTGYLIERCQGSGCTTFTQVATSSAANYSDIGLAASTAYTYRVRATDANSNLSGYSATASTTTLASGGDTTPPTAPTALGATAVSGTQINLSWTASTDNVGVTGYKVERCSGSSCSNFVQVATPTGTSYSDTGLVTSTTYTYRVRATDAAGNLSNYSNTAAATTQGTDTTPPTAPSGLMVMQATASQINLAWNASTDNVGVTAYLLERCTGEGCSNFAQIASTVGPSYNDVGLAANTFYSYRVRATDAANNLSSYSGVLSVITPAGSGTCHP